MHMIVLPLTMFEFTWLVINGFMEEHSLAFPVPEWRLDLPNTQGP